MASNEQQIVDEGITITLDKEGNIVVVDKDKKDKKVSNPEHHIKQWYRTKEGKKRLVAEIELLSGIIKEKRICEYYFCISRKSNNLLLVVKYFNKRLLQKKYIVLIDFPSSYPNTHLAQSVFILRPNLHPHSPHMWNNGSISFINPAQLLPNASVGTVLFYAFEWIRHYELWLNTGMWEIQE